MGCTITVKPPSTKYYSITGNTLEEVQKSIEKKGPKDPNDGKRVTAVTATDIIVADNWEPEVRKVAYGIGSAEVTVGVKNMKMTVEGTILMPKLGTNKLSPAAKKEWERFVKKLLVHEKEHMDVAQKVAEEMKKVIMAMTGVGTGGNDSKALTAAKEDFLKTYASTYSPKQISALISDAHKKFDKKTDHGAKHGARLDTSIK
ncbi:DUF922 domain-containing protein [Marimonas sp. MJW-29]|uniref:DUF922 domain-containing protein n=1 Tax=Sulfitobacter sediminis TaxID=3234186 RepID=A0ABV3RK93_9RHOB